MARTAVIIGAGPAGLTAAYELLKRTDVVPIVLERSDQMGGISRTVNYKGNRIDIGGHRFFSKSDRVVQWWLDRLSLEKTANGSELQLTYQNQRRSMNGNGSVDPESTDRVMLIRSRKSRIYFQRKFFDYPLSLSADTLGKLGLFQTMLIGISYCKSMMFPIRPEENLEEFFVNRFGRRLYETFFKSYTEKVWGVPCKDISAEWGAQRVKGLSIVKALTHMAKKALPKKQDLAQKDVETSLIEWFMYPKFGPGQVWEETSDLVRSLGGEILTNWKVHRLCHADDKITAVDAISATGEVRTFKGDFFFSTMPVKDLVQAMVPAPPPAVIEVASGLMYRDFITVGLLCKRLKLSEAEAGGKVRIKDNWIYIQEPDALVGRLQIFNNWSPYMVANQSDTWIGLEYFCNEGDELWRKTDAEMIALAKDEMKRLDIVDPAEVMDATVIRMEKTYPAYFGSYDRFPEIRKYVDNFANLFLIGRNGMHRYNNQDHSMLTAMVAVDNISAGITGKDNLWSVNTEQEYHEQK